MTLLGNSITLALHELLVSVVALSGFECTRAIFFLTTFSRMEHFARA